MGKRMYELAPQFSKVNLMHLKVQQYQASHGLIEQFQECIQAVLSLLLPAKITDCIRFYQNNFMVTRMKLVHYLLSNLGTFLIKMR